MPFKFKTSVAGPGNANIRPGHEYSAAELDALVPDWRNYLVAGVCEAIGEAPEAATKPKAKRTTTKRKTTTRKRAPKA